MCSQDTSIHFLPQEWMPLVVKASLNYFLKARGLLITYRQELAAENPFRVCFRSLYLRTTRNLGSVYSCSFVEALKDRTRFLATVRRTRIVGFRWLPRQLFGWDHKNRNEESRNALEESCLVRPIFFVTQCYSLYWVA